MDPTSLTRIPHPRQPGIIELQQYLGVGNGAINKLDDRALPAVPKKCPLFFAVDFESYEFNHHVITEIGVSAFDPVPLFENPGLADVSKASKWISRIDTRHFLIEENRRYVNKRHVKGCPDKFNFGVSELVSKQNTGSLLRKLFLQPVELSHDSDTASPSSSDLSSSSEYRPVILVGHAIENDVAYMRKLGFVPEEHVQVIASFDTQRLTSSKSASCSLKKLLDRFGVAPENLHNAGNDAHYTMQALLHIAAAGHDAPWFTPLNASLSLSEEKLVKQEGVKNRRERKQEKRQERLLAKGLIDQTGKWIGEKPWEKNMNHAVSVAGESKVEQEV